MSLQQKLYYAFCITKNRYLFSYGRKPKGDRLKRIKLPNASDIPSWAKSFDVSAYSNADVSVNRLPTPALDTANWQEFRYDKLFDIERGRGPRRKDLDGSGSTPFVTSSDSNNGLTGFTSAKPIHQGNAIGVNRNGSVAEAFYQPISFCSTEDVHIFKPKFELNPYIALFLATLIRKEKYRFSYGRKWGIERMNKSIIKLPIDGSGNPDWRYMENYIKSLPYSSQI